MMEFIKCFLAFGILLFSALIQGANADSMVYQCKQKNGQLSFSDIPCKADEKHLSASVIKALPETHSVVAIPRRDEQNYNYDYRAGRSTALLEQEEKRKNEQNRQWDSQGRVGVTLQNSPYTYGYTRFANH